MPRYPLSGRTVVITGSTGGLGSALCLALRAKGARLALLDLDLQAVTKQAASFGGNSDARGWPVDVRSLASVEAAMAAAARHFGRIDIVIANAGVESLAPLASIDPAAFERVIDINLNGVFRTFRAGLPYVEAQQGYLLAISSMAAFVHSPLQGAYTASKAGVWAMCDSVRLEVRHLDVGVGSVHPTFFRTPMSDAMATDPAGKVLWGGNERGLWKMVSLDRVVAGIVRGIERRAQFIVVPWWHRPIAWAPGHFRRWIEWIGLRRAKVREAVALAMPSSGGLKDAPATGARTPDRNNANMN